jgi:hypothetical protein
MRALSVEGEILIDKKFHYQIQWVENEMEHGGNWPYLLISSYLNFKRLSAWKPMTHRIVWRPVYPAMHNAIWRYASLIVAFEKRSVLLDSVTDSALSE